MPALIDMTDRRYGRWTVKGRAPNIYTNAAWYCTCSCGNEAAVNGASLRKGESRSCGCLSRTLAKDRATTHSKSHTRVHNAWRCMHKRCYNQNAACYAQYGGRGIKVCKRWHKFENFYADMGDPPASTSLDRKNNDGDYKPSNCRWATRAEQSRNTSRNVTGRYQGRVWCMTDLAQAHGISVATACMRLKRGIEFVAACTTPVRSKQ